MGRKTRTDFLTPAEDVTTPRKRKSTKRKRANMKLLLRLLIAVAVLLCLYAVAINWRYIAPDSFVSWVYDVIDGKTGGSWPVELSGDNITDMQEAGNNMVLLTDSATVYYNASGGESVRHNCAYADPLMRVSEGYVLLLEAGGTRYRLETRAGTESEMQLQNSICTGAVSAKGDVAVVTDSLQSYVSEVLVYSRRGTQRYQWFSSEWLVMDVAFSRDGNDLAVIGCRAVNGAMESAILVFDLRGREEQPVQYIAPQATYTRVQFTRSGTVVAVGDTQARFVNPTGSLDTTVSLQNEELIGFAFADTDTMIVTRSYGSQETGTARIFSASGDLRAEHTFEGAFRDAAIMRGSFLLLTDRYVYDMTHSAVRNKAGAQTDSLMVGSASGKPLVLGLTTLDTVEWEKQE